MSGLGDLSDLPPEVIRELSRAARQSNEPAKQNAPRPVSRARETVRREYPLGTRLDVIAAMCGVSKQRVEQIARALGLEQRKKTGRHRPAEPKGLRKNASLVRRAAAAIAVRAALQEQSK